MRAVVLIVAVLGLAAMVAAQTVPPAPLPSGMRVVVGSPGALLRNSPTVYSCGTPAHECTQADVLPPATYGVIQPDAPVLDIGGKFYWARVVFDAATPAGDTTGWASTVSPYVNELVPPQMVSGSNFSIGASYGPGPILTQAICILDGVNSPATMQLQNVTCCSDNGPGHAGTLLCPWPNAGIGNHKAVVKAVNSKGTADSEEFQFSVTSAPLSQVPAQPSGLRLAVP